MNLENQRAESEETMSRDKAAYLRRIGELSQEDQRFIEGFLFAKVTEKKGEQA
jgi:hypothetical protein